MRRTTLEKQRHLEFLSRFLVHTYIPYDGKLDVEEYIDKGLVYLATNNETVAPAACFKDTFRLLNSLFGTNALRRVVNGDWSGRVGLAAYECIAVGIAKNIEHIRLKPSPENFIRERVTEFWKSPDLDQFFTAGLRGTIRIQRTIPFGAQWFSV